MIFSILQKHKQANHAQKGWLDVLTVEDWVLKVGRCEIILSMQPQSQELVTLFRFFISQHVPCSSKLLIQSRFCFETEPCKATIKPNGVLMCHTKYKMFN